MSDSTIRWDKDSDGVVVLTRALARWLRENALLGSRPELEVVPCCVDLAKFAPRERDRDQVRAELGLGDALTLVYSGSLGTWYLEPEMIAFARAIRERAGKRTVFLCFTPSDGERLRHGLEAAGFPPGDIVVQRVPPPRMPMMLAAGDIGLSFIQSCFSKKGSSPTKVAEYLACGNIAVVNGDIGDQADLAAETEACVVLDGFSAAEVDRGAERALALLRGPREARAQHTRDVARRHFGLEEVGIARYAKLYETLARV